MQTIHEASRELPLLGEVDVVVVGGGPAGVGTAIAAGRNGAKTVLIERFGVLGGCQTVGLDATLTWVDSRIQGGIVQEIYENVNAAGMVYEDSAARIRDHWSNKDGSIFFDGEYYRHLLDELMTDAGVKVYFHALAVDVIKEGRLIKGIVIECLEGRFAIMAKVVVDCTGIGNIAWRSGASCIGEDGYADNRYGPFKGMHMGLGYGFFLRGLDYQKFRKFAEENVAEWDFWVKGKSLFAQAKAQGKLYSQRVSCLLTEYTDGRVWILNPYYKLEKGLHPWMLEPVTAGTVDMRKQAWSCYNVLKDNVPGFENTKIEQTPTCILLRDGHRIVGDYTMSEDDMRSAKSFEDSVCVSNMPPDPFFPDGTHHFKFDVTPYDVPYRCLISKDFDNLMCAGGVASMDLITWAAMRYCTTSITTGQAVGTAAAMASKTGVTPKEVDIRLLQKNLRDQGMHTTNKTIPADVIQEYADRATTWGDGFKIGK